jgi:hypothetical protein
MLLAMRNDLILYGAYGEVEQHILDVVITNQSCPSQLAQHHSDTVTDSANIDKERLKSHHYRDWIENVIPIAIEATGRFGPSALK